MAVNTKSRRVNAARMNTKTQWHSIVKFIAEKPQKFINQNYGAEVSLFEFAGNDGFFRSEHHDIFGF